MSTKAKKGFRISPKVKQYLPFYLFLLPAVIWYIVFAYYPMAGIAIAFQRFRFSQGFFGGEWVGLRYFREFMTDPYFWDIFTNTIVISISKLLFGFPAPIILALMLNEVHARKFKRTVQTISYLPYFVSWVVVYTLINKFFSPTTGLINELRVSRGLEPIYYLGRRDLFLPFVVLSDIWKNVGYGSIIYLAALAGVDSTLYDAASVDGAGRWKQLIHVTIPGIVPVIGITFLLNMGGMFGANMEQLLLLQTPSTFDVSEVIDTYVLKRGINMNQFDYATAVGLFRSVISLALVIVVNKVSARLTQISLF